MKFAFHDKQLLFSTTQFKHTHTHTHTHINFVHLWFYIFTNTTKFCIQASMIPSDKQRRKGPKVAEKASYDVIEKRPLPFTVHMCSKLICYDATLSCPIMNIWTLFAGGFCTDLCEACTQLAIVSVCLYMTLFADLKHACRSFKMGCVLHCARCTVSVQTTFASQHKAIWHQNTHVKPSPYDVPCRLFVLIRRSLNKLHQTVKPTQNLHRYGWKKGLIVCRLSHTLTWLRI
jgi:hypothetical protein